MTVVRWNGVRPTVVSATEVPLPALVAVEPATATHNDNDNNCNRWRSHVTLIMMIMSSLLLVACVSLLARMALQWPSSPTTIHTRITTMEAPLASRNELPASCQQALLVADANHDWYLNRYPEYATYVDYMMQLSTTGKEEGPHAVDTDRVPRRFEDLAQILQDTFEVIRRQQQHRLGVRSSGTGSSIDITSAYYQHDNISSLALHQREKEDKILRNLCSHTRNGIALLQREERLAASEARTFALLPTHLPSSSQRHQQQQQRLIRGSQLRHNATAAMTMQRRLEPQSTSTLITRCTTIVESILNNNHHNNNGLTKQDYTTLVHQVFLQEHRIAYLELTPPMEFDALPQSLRAYFQQWADQDGILSVHPATRRRITAAAAADIERMDTNVFAGRTSAAEQGGVDVDTLCQETQTMVQAWWSGLAMESPPPPPPTNVDDATANIAASMNVDDMECQRLVQFSNIGETGKWTAQEYYNFVVSMTDQYPRISSTWKSFDELPNSFNKIFLKRAGADDAVDLKDVNTNAATLEAVCAETRQAIYDALSTSRKGPTLDTSQAGVGLDTVRQAPGKNSTLEASNTTNAAPATNTTLAASVQHTLPPGAVSQLPNASSALLKIHNSWIVSNTHAIIAAAMDNNTDDKQGLVETYKIFVEEIFAKLASQRPATTAGRRALRGHRRLSVSIIPDTADISGYVDVVCPSTAAQDANCMAAFGQYDILVDGEDPNAVYNYFVSNSQVAIQQGLMQRILEQVDPASVFFVEGQSEPVTMSGPTAAVPPPAPASWNNAMIAGLIVAIAIAIFLTIVVICFVFRPEKDKQIKDQKEEELEAEALANAANNAANETESEEETEEEEDSSDEEEESSEEEEESEEVDDDEEEEEEESTTLEASANIGNDEETESKAGPEIPENPWRAEIEALVRKVCPDQLKNVDALLEQFKGREPALIRVLKNMERKNIPLQSKSDLQVEVVKSESAEGPEVPVVGVLAAPPMSESDGESEGFTSEASSKDDKDASSFVSEASSKSETENDEERAGVNVSRSIPVVDKDSSDSDSEDSQSKNSKGSGEDMKVVLARTTPPIDESDEDSESDTSNDGNGTEPAVGVDIAYVDSSEKNADDDEANKTKENPDKFDVAKSLGPDDAGAGLNLGKTTEKDAENDKHADMKSTTPADDEHADRCIEVDMDMDVDMRSTLTDDEAKWRLRNPMHTDGEANDHLQRYNVDDGTSYYQKLVAGNFGFRPTDHEYQEPWNAQYEGHPYSEQPFAGHEYAGQPYAGQDYGGQPHAGQEYRGQDIAGPYAGQEHAEHPYGGPEFAGQQYASDRNGPGTAMADDADGSDFSYESGDDSVGYEIQWFQVGGAWKARKVPKQLTGRGSDDEYESDDAGEGLAPWRWVEKGSKWVQELVTDNFDDEFDESWDEDDSALSFQDDTPNEKWVQRNGAWVREVVPVKPNGHLQDTVATSRISSSDSDPNSPIADLHNVFRA